MLKRRRPTAQGRRCKCTECSESTACHRPRFPPASGAFEAASCFLSRVNPQLYSQALQRPTAQGRRCKCTGCSESTACHRPRFPSKWRLQGRLLLSLKKWRLQGRLLLFIAPKPKPCRFDQNSKLKHKKSTWFEFGGVSLVCGSGLTQV